MKYPYIGKYETTNTETLCLFYKEGFAINLDDKQRAATDLYLENAFKDITREYLSNTWGVVESKEHAEFIIELAVNCGFEQRTGLEKAYPCYFCLDKDEVYFFSQKHNASNDGEKQITISLPPKTKEWPQVGDEVLTSDEIGVVKSPQDSKGFYAVLIDGELSLLHNTEFEKPKSKQELLIEDLQTKLCNNNAVDNYILACDIINGEIEGLSYEVK